MRWCVLPKVTHGRQQVTKPVITTTSQWSHSISGYEAVQLTQVEWIETAKQRTLVWLGMRMALSVQVTTQSCEFLVQSLGPPVNIIVVDWSVRLCSHGGMSNAIGNE